MLLPSLSLSLESLLFFQLLSGSGLPKALPLGPLVPLEVDGSLQSRVASSTRHNLGPELSLKVQKPQRSELNFGFQPHVIGHHDWQIGQLVNPVSYPGSQPVLSFLQQCHRINAARFRNRSDPVGFHALLLLLARLWTTRLGWPG
jgi:hypothetical protein